MSLRDIREVYVNNPKHLRNDDLQRQSCRSTHIFFQSEDRGVAGVFPVTDI